MPEPSTDTLAAWLSPVTVAIDADGLKAYGAAVSHVFAKATSRELLDVVALAHGAGTPATRAWFTELARVKQPEMPLTANDKLVAVLAAAVAVRALTTPGASRAAVALGAQSAAFVGLKPVQPEVINFAESTAAELADAARRRALKPDPISAAVPGWVDEGNAPPTDDQPASGRSAWELPIVRAAAAMDAFAAEIQTRLVLLDEEYNLLWWSHAGRSVTADVPWGEVTPAAKRAVLIADELAARITHVPAPPIVDGLAAVALGDVAKKSLSLAETVAAIRDVSTTTAPFQHTVLPISTVATEAAKYDDDTWIKVVKQEFKIDAKAKHEATQIARQLIRERQLGTLL